MLVPQIMKKIVIMYLAHFRKGQVHEGEMLRRQSKDVMVQLLVEILWRI
jgi:hypothetical protein